MEAARIARRRRIEVDAFPLALGAGVALTVAAGLAALALGHEWGAPLQPFLARLEPRVAPTAVVAAAVLGAAIPLSLRLASPRAEPRAFAAGALALALATRLAVALARDGTAGWYAVFGDAPEAKNEYLPALPALDYGPRWFLDRFAETVPSLPVHAAGHPPGLLLTLHALGIDGAEAMAALTIGVGVLVVPLTYALARRLLDEPAARRAALLCAFAPSALLYGATSADALYATLGAAAAVLLVARGAIFRAGGAAALALASLFSYALLAIGAWAAIVVACRDGLRGAATTAVACGAALVALYVGLYAATGFDVLGAMAATEDVYRFSVARVRPYAFWVVGSPAAFLVALGLPLAWYAAHSAAVREPAAIALFAVVAVSALLGFTKAETERIWLFLVPLACVAAAAAMPARRLGAVLGALAVQALAAELLLDTVW